MVLYESPCLYCKRFRGSATLRSWVLQLWPSLEETGGVKPPNKRHVSLLADQGAVRPPDKPRVVLTMADLTSGKSLHDFFNGKLEKGEER